MKIKMIIGSNLIFIMITLSVIYERSYTYVTRFLQGEFVLFSPLAYPLQVKNKTILLYINE